MADKINIINGSNNKDAVSLQINPASVKINKKVSYEKITFLGREEVLSRYKSHEPSSLSFEVYFDDTGVIPNGNITIQDRITKLEKALYNRMADSKEPGYSILVWGSIIFHGRAESIDYEYTLFASDGSPLRVKVSLSFVGYFKEGQVQAKGKSQAINVVIFKSGDSLADYCSEIYDDPSYCTDVARQNGLQSIRNIVAGTIINFNQKKR